MDLKTLFKNASLKNRLDAEAISLKERRDNDRQSKCDQNRFKILPDNAEGPELDTPKIIKKSTKPVKQSNTSDPKWV